MAISQQRIPTPDERAARLLAAEREASAAVRRLYAGVILICFAWMSIGLLLLGWAFHTTNEDLGRIAFLGGILVGDIGILSTVLFAWNRAQREGLI